MSLCRATNAKPLKPTKKQKQAIVRALDEFEDSVDWYARGLEDRAVRENAHSKLLALLGITEEEWREM